MTDSATLHASCVVVGETGILIRGPSGAGKSALARELIAAAAARENRFARLVADDRVRLDRRGGRLIARPVPDIAGLVEIRHIGIVPTPFEPAAVVRLVVDLTEPAPARLPDRDDLKAEILDVVLPRLAFAPPGVAAAALAEPILWRLRDLDDTLMTVR